MSAIDKIERHYKKIQAVVKGWDEAIEAAKTKIRREYNQKRNDLKEKLNKSRDEEQELISNYQRTETQLNNELTRISHQIASLETQTTQQPLDFSMNFDRKNQQLDQIYSDSHKEMILVIDRHKDKVKRMEQILFQNVAQEKKLANYGAAATTHATVTPIKAILDVQKRNMSETIAKLEAIRDEIEKKLRELSEIDKREVEDIERSEKQCIESEAKERSEEMNKFIIKIKDYLKKH